jgi:hypothetical protein
MASAAKASLPTSQHKRRVNELILERSAADGSAPSQPVAFVCECESAACFQTVWMSAAEYEQQRLVEEWTVLGARHR